MVIMIINMRIVIIIKLVIMIIISAVSARLAQYFSY